MTGNDLTDFSLSPDMRLIRRLRHVGREWLAAFAAALPGDILSMRLRVQIWRWLGVEIETPAYVHRHVLLLGRIRIGQGSSISHNCCLNGAQAGLTIGRKVMIAPGCTLVAFDHGTALGAGPMIDQPWVESAINIGDDVWVGANCTVARGVNIGNGAVIGANSFVNTDVPANTIYAGVPARHLRDRI